MTERSSVCLIDVRNASFRDGVKFPTGGKSPRVLCVPCTRPKAIGHVIHRTDPVQLRDRQYSLEGRRDVACGVCLCCVVLAASFLFAALRCSPDLARTNTSSAF